jgi:hypothetical protein
MRAWSVAALMALGSGLALADDSLVVCFNYGCTDSALVRFAPQRLAAVHGMLSIAADAPAERAALSRAVGLLYRVAGEQSPIAADRGGNYPDQGVDGRMDCIDHSTTTTRLLGLVEARGWLRFHRVLAPARRTRFVFQHFSAVIEEIEAPPAVPVPPVAAPVPDHVAVMLALCDCPDVLDDIPRPPPAAPPPPNPAQAGARFAVDSWFVDHGDPAVVLPLAEWLKGEGPNVH